MFLELISLKSISPRDHLTQCPWSQDPYSELQDTTWTLDEWDQCDTKLSHPDTWSDNRDQNTYGDGGRTEKMGSEIEFIKFCLPVSRWKAIHNTSTHINMVFHASPRLYHICWNYKLTQTQSRLHTHVHSHIEYGRFVGRGQRFQYWRLVTRSGFQGRFEQHLKPN